MLITILKGKIHRAKVTGSDLDYEGSIFIDKHLLEQAGIIKYEKVDIYNVSNGARFSTYAVPVEQKDSVCVNGAAARLVQKNDILIICAFCTIQEEDAKIYQPKVVLL